MSALVGIILGWGIVFTSIRLATPDMLSFWDLNSFLLVIIGPYFSMLMAYSGKDVNSANKKWLGAFKKDVPIPYKDEVGRFVRWAYITQKNGLQGLENDAMSTVGQNRLNAFADQFVVIVAEQTMNRRIRRDNLSVGIDF